MVNVTKPSISQILLNKIEEIEKRIRSQTPAVTRVELCTKALTGVGAAIAAGSQLTKGHWALFVIETIHNRINKGIASISSGDFIKAVNQ